MEIRHVTRGRAEDGNNTSRTLVSSDSPWEPLVGYSRAVRVGAHVYVAGTTGLGADGELVGVGDPYLQTVQALDNVEAALLAAGAELRHVVRTRIFVTNIEDWREVGKAHAERFGEIRPACTMVEVARLISADMLVEIEADAVVEV